MPEQGTVFIVDDDPAVLDALEQLFRSQGLSAEGFPDAESYLKAISPEQPGVLVVDVRMPGLSGLDLLRQMHADGTFRECIVLSGHADVPAAVQAMQLGARTFLEKPVPHQELLDAVRNAWDCTCRQRLVDEFRRSAESMLQTLAPEEMMVLEEIARGQTNSQAAQTLDISLRTVQLRLSVIYRKLRVRSKAELLQWLRRISWTVDTTS